MKKLSYKATYKTMARALQRLRVKELIAGPRFSRSGTYGLPPNLCCATGALFVAAGNKDAVDDLAEAAWRGRPDFNDKAYLEILDTNEGYAGGANDTEHRIGRFKAIEQLCTRKLARA